MASTSPLKEIQDLILPDLKQLQEVLPDCFCLLIPKQIVGGDFYW
jgi:hypothetical protein